MTHSAPRHAGVRNESPARVGAPHQQRKPPSMASRRRRAGRHAGRKRWGLPSARADQGRRPHARSRSSARARRADPRSLAGAAHVETRARAGKLPWPKKPPRTNLLTLRRANLEARGQASAPGRFQDRPLSGRAERPAATCSCKPHRPSPYDRCATTLSWEPHCDRTRVAASGAGGAVARGAARKRPAAPRRRGLHKARGLERRVPGGPHARRCLRSLPLRPPAVPTEVRPGGTAHVRLVNDRGLGRRHRREGPWMR